MGSFQGGLLEGAETVVCTKSGPPQGGRELYMPRPD